MREKPKVTLWKKINKSKVKYMDWAFNEGNSKNCNQEWTKWMNQEQMEKHIIQCFNMACAVSCECDCTLHAFPIQACIVWQWTHLFTPSFSNARCTKFFKCTLVFIFLHCDLKEKYHIRRKINSKIIIFEVSIIIILICRNLVSVGPVQQRIKLPSP